MYIVTGGGSGLGRALAHALSIRNQSVLVLGRNEKEIVKTASFSDKIKYLRVDVTSDLDRKSLVSYLDTTQTIKGLIHNAGIIDPIVPITEISENSWHAIMSTNLDAPFFLTQMLKDKLTSGRVLNIGSGAAHFPVSGWAAYCVSKAALSMLTQCWQLESNSIAFTSVMPGIVDTNMQDKIRQAQHMNPKKREFFKNLKQKNKLVSPEIVALFLCWLLLDTDRSLYTSREWDIYDKTHHSEWLVAPYVVHDFE